MTTTERTPSQRAAFSRNKGAEAERDLARYLRPTWPGACRAVRTGSSAAADPGDVAGVPGVIVSVKNCRQTAWTAWWTELDAMLEADPAALGVIVEKRAGCADPGGWWAHLRLSDLGALLAATRHPRGGPTVRVTVAQFVDLLVGAGYARDAA